MAIHLPYEILNQIMGYLIPMVPRKHQESGIQDYRSLRPTDLSSLCLVCQRFHHIAQPLLYHTINVTDKTALAHYPHRHKWPGFLLRTIAEQPYLAKYIRVIALSDMVTLHQSPLTGFPWDVPRSIRCALQIALAGEGPNVLPIVLLLYATMVEKIFFCPADVDGVEVPWILTSWKPQGVQSLSRFICPPDFGPDLTLELGPFANYDLPCLKELYVEPDETNFFYCHSLMDFIKKPGLSTFHLSYGRCTTYFVPQALEDTPSSLRVLKLENCFMDSQSLKRILNSCPNLGVLNIHTADTKWAEDGDIPWTIDLGDIGQALRDNGSNLTDLRLDFSNFKMTRKATSRIGSLYSILGLRHLQCYRNDMIITRGGPVGEQQEQNVLPLESVLPSSMATLHLFYDESYVPFSPPGNIISREIDSILSSGRLHSLQEIQLQRYYGSSEEAILFQTKMPGWSFDSRTIQCGDQNGFIEYISIHRL